MGKSIVVGMFLAVAVAIAAASPAPQLDCVEIRSPQKLQAGSTLRKPIQNGLEFRLSKDWDISIGPAADRTLDYLWLVSPPIRTAPQRRFGAGYGVTAKESTQLKRSLRFVLNQPDHDAALEALDLPDGAETLKRLDVLGRGTLILYIDKYELNGDALRWIQFHGEACVPKSAT